MLRTGNPALHSLPRSTLLFSVGSFRGSFPVLPARLAALPAFRTVITRLLLDRLESLLDGDFLDLPVFDVDRDLAAEDGDFDLELALVGIHH